MEQRYTMKSIAIECQSHVEDIDIENSGTSEANISNFFSTCFDKLGLKEEWTGKRKGKAYEFTKSEKDILVELFQNRDIILKNSMDNIEELRALFEKMQGLFDDKDIATVNGKLEGFIIRILCDNYQDRFKKAFNNLVDEELNGCAIYTDRNHFLQSRDLKYWIKVVVTELRRFAKQWKSVFIEMESIQREQLVDEIWDEYGEHDKDMQLGVSEEILARLKKDRKYQDLKREYKREDSKKAKERINSEMRKREEELYNMAMGDVIDRYPRPLGSSPSELLKKACDDVRVPCYKMDCETRWAEIREKRLKEIQNNARLIKT